MSIPSPEELFNEMKTLFIDVTFFDSDVAPSLKEAVDDCQSIAVFKETKVKKLAAQYHKISKEGDERSEMITLIFQTLCVLIVSKKAQATEQYFKDVNELLDQYPSFQFLSADELILLLKFRNMVRACLCVMKGKGNKQTILNIAGRLEGTQETYITGSGQRNAVKHRVAIYEKESGIKPEVRGNRRLKGGNAPALQSHEVKIDATPAPVQKKRKADNEPPPSPQKAKRQALSGAFPLVRNLESSGSYGNKICVDDASTAPLPISPTDAELLEHLELQLDLDPSLWDDLHFLSLNGKPPAKETSPLSCSEDVCVERSHFAPPAPSPYYSEKDFQDACELLL